MKQKIGYDIFNSAVGPFFDSLEERKEKQDMF